MRGGRLFILTALLLLPFCKAIASHIVGGEVTYTYIGSVAGGNKYDIYLTIYEDCQNGSPGAIPFDNPAFIAVYDLSHITSLAAPSVNPQYPGYAICDSTVEFTSSINVPANFNNACVENVPEVCLIKKVFKKTFILPLNSSGYVVTYQRCCRNAQIININDPGGAGATYFCIIPPASVTTHNSSAVYTNFPPQIICVNNPFYYDNSATDADGDSLSYEFCSATDDGGSSATKPNPPAPPALATPPYYSPVSYIAPFTSDHPLTAFPPLQIDPVTGIITGTPTQIGRYLVTVCCNEWRHGVLINTMKREFQFVVTDCSKLVVACIPQYSTDVNTYLVDCTRFDVKFVNCSKGGFTYHWDFGVPFITSDTSNAFQPTYTYPDTGIFTVKLVVNPGSTCPDSISRFVKIFPSFSTAFTDSGIHCPNIPLFFIDGTATTIKPITSWLWNFGDGNSSSVQNPQHTYSYGGTFNVMLVSENIKNCIDTSVRQVVIESFKPFAGDDTIIVKGEGILFNATGGDHYIWSPVTYLNDTNINNPYGIFPDTGRFSYIVKVVSAYGCTGYDTINVRVVDQAAFYVPTGFSPNGDGWNDVFRPVAIGYRSLNYFRVYNRWGQQVYYSENLTSGWDGTYNHKDCELGTYFWQISFVDRFGKQGYMKGDVTLVR